MFDRVPNPRLTLHTKIKFLYDWAESVEGHAVSKMILYTIQ